MRVVSPNTLNRSARSYSISSSGMGSGATPVAAGPVAAPVVATAAALPAVFAVPELVVMPAAMPVDATPAVVPVAFAESAGTPFVSFCMAAFLLSYQSNI